MSVTLLLFSYFPMAHNVKFLRGHVSLMQMNVNLLYVNSKGSEQPAHPCSTFVFLFLKSIIARVATCKVSQGSHRLEKYLNLEGFLEKSLKIKHALKITGKSLKNHEKSLNSTIFCRT